MTQREIDKIADECGMIVCELKTEDGETEYIGTTKQWNEFKGRLDKELSDEANRITQNDIL